MVEIVLALMFIALGMAHFVPNTGSALEEHYRWHWGVNAHLYQRIIGAGFVIGGVAWVISSLGWFG